MDTNILVAIISAVASIISALIAARGQGNRKQVEEVGPTKVIVEKRLLSPGWRAVLWIIAVLFAFSFIGNLRQPTIYSSPLPMATMCVTAAGVVCTLPLGSRGAPCTCFTPFGLMQGVSQ
jgi:hypothetical protein